jgi:hypothetical protein
MLTFDRNLPQMMHGNRMNIEELESRYMELFWAQRRSQWENYVDEAHHDLCAYDEQIFGKRC